MEIFKKSFDKALIIMMMMCVMSVKAKLIESDTIHLKPNGDCHHWSSTS